MTEAPRGADLHLHTIYSDGIYTPESLVRAAVMRSLRAVAVTDHDSVAGVGPTREAAAGSGLEVVAGIELAVPMHQTEFHIVGLFVDGNPTSLRRHLVELRARRRGRMMEMVRRLGRLGIYVSAEEVFAAAEPALPGRVHLAQVLAAQGKVSTYQAAFQELLGTGKAAYVPRRWPGLADALGIIHEAGGLAVYAHPLLTGRDEAIPELVEAGVDAIEVSHPNHSGADVRRYREMCERWNLLAAGGSDCHGNGQGLIGTARLSDEEYETLKRAAAKRSVEAGRPESAE